MVHRQLTGSWTEWMKWLLRQRRHLVVRGESMLPTLAPGDHILLDPGAYRRSMPTAGDVVVARHPFEQERILVKRVTSVDERGRCFLQGDNPIASTDSHRLAPFIPELILGRVTRVLP